MRQAGPETTTAEAFGAFATFLGTPLPDDPLAALRRLRKEAAAEVERLLTLLDATDGDPDLEDGADDEPSIGSYSGDDREHDDADDEPSSGWSDGIPGNSANKATDELEPDEGSEPSLASPENPRGGQMNWARGCSNELEGDPKEDDEENGDLEPSIGAGGGGIDCEGDDCDDEENGDADRGAPPSKRYVKRLAERRPKRSTAVSPISAAVR